MGYGGIIVIESAKYILVDFKEEIEAFNLGDGTIYVDPLCEKDFLNKLKEIKSK